jgi:hypothetical protein
MAIIVGPSIGAEGRMVAASNAGRGWAEAAAAKTATEMMVRVRINIYLL